MPPPLGHIYKVCQDLQGNIVPEVLGTVFVAGTNEPAALFADLEGTQPLPNPVVNNADFGSFSVYVDAGHYDMTFVKVGYVFETIEDVQVLPGSGGVHSLQGTPNQVLVSQPFGVVTLSTPQNLDPDAAIQFARLGLGTPATSAQLAVVGPSTFTGLAQFDNVSITGGSATLAALTVQGLVNAKQFLVQDHAGDNVVAFHSTVQAAGGTNRWFLYGGGTAPSLLNGTLQVNGVAGLGGAAVGGYSITAYGGSQLAANVTIGMLGTAATQALDVNGVVRARAGVIADTNITTGTLYASGLVTALSLNATNIWGTYLAAGGGIDTRFTLRSYGNTYFDGVVNMGSEAGYKLNVGGNVYMSGVLGVGTAPNGAYSIITGGALYIAGAAHFNSSLYVAGQLTGAANFNTNNITCTVLQATSNIIANACQISYGGFGYAGLGGYSLRAGASWCDSLFVAGGSDGVHTFRCYGHSYMDGNLRVAINLAVGAVEPGYEGYGFHVQPNAKFRAALHCDGPATKPGGGPWADSSSRTLKRDITDIAGALALLLAQRGRQYVWAEETHARLLPGVQYGLVREEVTVPQWLDAGGETLTTRGFEALAVEALREIVQRLEALERQG